MSTVLTVLERSRDRRGDGDLVVNLVELLILAAAHQLAEEYSRWVGADLAFDGGEFSSSFERRTPEAIESAWDVIRSGDHLDPPDAEVLR